LGKYRMNLLPIFTDENNNAWAESYLSHNVLLHPEM